MAMNGYEQSGACQFVSTGNFQEKLMVKHADLLVCDSKNIEQYIQEDYKQYQPKTTYIAYGTVLLPQILKAETQGSSWYQEKRISENGYFQVVGRFVPEKTTKP